MKWSSTMATLCKRIFSSFNKTDRITVDEANGKIPFQVNWFVSQNDEHDIDTAIYQTI